MHKQLAWDQALYCGKKEKKNGVRSPFPLPRTPLGWLRSPMFFLFDPVFFPFFHHCGAWY